MFLQEYSAKIIQIQRDKIVYKVPQKNAEHILFYFTALIEQAVIDLEEVSKEITDQKKIEFFKIHQGFIESQLKKMKVKCQFLESIVSDDS